MKFLQFLARCHLRFLLVYKIAREQLRLGANTLLIWQVRSLRHCVGFVRNHRSATIFGILFVTYCMLFLSDTKKLETVEQASYTSHAEFAELPTIDFYVTETPACVNDTIAFWNNSCPTDNIFIWDFGLENKEPAININPYQVPGTFQIQVVTSNFFACDVSSDYIEVLPVPEVDYNGSIEGAPIYLISSSIEGCWLGSDITTELCGQFNPELAGNDRLSFAVVQACSKQFDSYRCVNFNSTVEYGSSYGPAGDISFTGYIRGYGDREFHGNGPECSFELFVGKGNGSLCLGHELLRHSYRDLIAYDDRVGPGKALALGPNQAGYLDHGNIVILPIATIPKAPVQTTLSKWLMVFLCLLFSLVALLLWKILIRLGIFRLSKRKPTSVTMLDEVLRMVALAELEKALLTFEQTLEGRNLEIRKQIIHLQFQLQEVEKEYRMNMIKSEDAFIVKNRIAWATLDLVSKVQSQPALV